MIRFIRNSAISDKGRSAAGSDKYGEHHYSKIYNEDELKDLNISGFLKTNMDNVNKVLGNNGDLVTRYITLGRIKTTPAAVVFLENMIDSKLVDNEIIRPLVLDAYTSGLNTSDEIIAQLKAGNLIAKGQTRTVKDFYELSEGILRGEASVFIEGVKEAYIISAQGYKYRSVSQTEIEPVVRGPREAFIEDLNVNIGLIRRRIHSPNLVIDLITMGTVGKTKVCIAYIKGLCPDELYQEVMLRINKIKIDNVLETSYIEEFIQDSPYSIFPQLRNTERPDVVAASLLEGRVAILADNSPIAIIAPGEFFSLMQTPEDYYNRYAFSSLVRILRYFCLFLAVLLPALYIAVTNYHQEMLPTSLLISIISARSQVPFPAFIEALVLELIFEILTEAGVRLPRPVGQAVSIVGALVIGQSAVQANIVSPLMVIIVALTGIASFCIPQFNIALPVRIVRFALMFLAAIFGLYGVMIGVLFTMLHLFSLESFGKPYMAPLSPMRPEDMKDTLVRFPWWAFKNHVKSRNSEPSKNKASDKKRGE